MIINCYFTDGYFDWGKLFVESYKYHNGEDKRMILFTKNLKGKQIKELESLYKNIEVRNENLSLDKIANKANISKKELIKFKNQTEKVKVNSNNKVWKLMIAGDNRIKNIYSLLKEIPENEHVLHFDVDMYITGKLDKIMEEVRKNDFTTRFRIKKQIERQEKVHKPNRATLIYIQGYTVNKKSLDFIQTWIKHIDKIEPSKRPKGYGQTTCYYAYLDMNKKYKDFKWGQIEGNLMSFYKSANKGSKSNNLRNFRKHFENLIKNNQKK